VGDAPATGAKVATGRPEPRILRLAHRGDWRHAPENTLEALIAAAAIAGCDGVEFDVRLASDGVPVLLHDETLARVQHRPELVDELTADELGTARVPSLASVLRALPASAFLDVELKGTNHGAATATALREARGERPDRAVISSFEDATLAAMATYLPGWARWLNADNLERAVIGRAVDLGCRVISVHWAAITPASAAATHAAGLELAAWTVRTREDFERLAALGVRAVCVEDEALDDGRSP
jgi:glycerophosphoryl diester phosphodiesterase